MSIIKEKNQKIREKLLGVHALLTDLYVEKKAIHRNTNEEARLYNKLKDIE